MLTHEIYMDVSRKHSTIKINTVQGDSGRSIDVHLLDMNIPDGASAKFYAKKPDGNTIYNNCEITSPTVVRVGLTTQVLAVTGTVPAMIEIMYDGKTITTFEFDIIVNESVVDLSAVESSSEFTALQTALLQVASLESRINALETAIAKALLTE